MQQTKWCAPLTIAMFAILALSTHVHAQKTETAARVAPPTNWEPVGLGIAGTRVADLIVYDGKLIACGSFTQAGGNPASNIAAWDGASWTALGTGLDNGAIGMAVYGGELIVAGNFFNAGGNPATRVAAWDGTTWSAVGAGVASNPSAIAADGGGVYVARNSALPPHGVQISYVDRWTGANWYLYRTYYADPLTDQVQINALEVIDGVLWAGGLSIGGGPLAVYSFGGHGGNVYAGGYDTLLERWDGGTTWTPLDNTWAPNCGFTFAIQSYNGLLVAGGDFPGAGCTPDPYLITWDGASFSTLGNKSMNGRVLALAQHNGTLFAAGEFTKVGNDVVSRIAQWQASVPVRQMSIGDVRKLYQSSGE